jgi:hypothetical protein
MSVSLGPITSRLSRRTSHAASGAADGEKIMSNEEIIVKVGAEGGDLTLYGARSGNGWLFSLNVFDCTSLLLDEDDGGGPAIQHRSSPVISWSDAIALLDRYPWAKLHPLAVHPEFRKKVWNEAQRRLDHNGDNHGALNRWREICEVDTESWLDSYYEALEFFYWEPQHMVPKTLAAAEFKTLAKIAKKQSSKVDDVRRHLRKMEVTLNHNIRQFLLLAPDALRNTLFEKIFGQAFDGAFVMQGSREIDIEFELRGCMQPDFSFISEGSVVSIEMKVEAKCRIEQVLKYVLLGLAVERKQERQKEHYLILLGTGVFASLFRGRFESIEKLIDAVGNYDLSLFLKNKPRHLRERPERFSQIAKQMHLEFVTYEHLARLLGDAAPSEIDQSQGAEVYRKAISGLVDEFKRRQLL